MCSIDALTSRPSVWPVSPSVPDYAVGGMHAAPIKTPVSSSSNYIQTLHVKDTCTVVTLLIRQQDHSFSSPTSSDSYLRYRYKRFYQIYPLEATVQFSGIEAISKQCIGVSLPILCYCMYCA